jgi:hypothetical protein
VPEKLAHAHEMHTGAQVEHCRRVAEIVHAHAAHRRTVLGRSLSRAWPDGSPVAQCASSSGFMIVS